MPGILDQSSFRVQIWTHHLGDAGAESPGDAFEIFLKIQKAQLVVVLPDGFWNWRTDDNKNVRHQGTWHFCLWRKYCKMWQRMWYTHNTALGIISSAQSSTCFAWVDLTFHEHCQSTLQFWSGLASSIFAKACKGWKVILNQHHECLSGRRVQVIPSSSLSLCLPLPVSLFLSFVSRELVPTISYYLSYLLLFDNDLIIITSNGNSYGYGKEGCLSCCRWLLEGERSSLPGENAGDTPVFLFPAASAMPLTVIPCWPNMVLSYLQEFWNVKAERLNLSCRQNKIRMELFRELLQVSPCCGDGRVTRNPVGSGAQCVLVIQINQDPRIHHANS